MFKVDTNDFVAAIKRTIPHTAKPAQNTPVLEAVRLTTVGEYLVLSATDCYTLVEARVRLLDGATGHNDPFDALIPASALKTLVPIIKARSATTFEPGEGSVIVDGVTLEYQQGNFPNVSKLWPEKLHALQADSVNLGVDNLKKLTALRVSARDNDPISFYGTTDAAAPDGGTRKPVVVVYGQHARVLVMPVSVGAQPAWSEWDVVPSQAQYAEAVGSAV